MDFLTSSLLALTIVCTIMQLLRARKPSNLPPGPYGPPIIGNILHLGTKPHHSLDRLARKHGPVMTLKLGSITTVVISSPEAAKIVLQKHDLSFSGRAIASASEAYQHDEFSMVWLPVGKQWRKLRKILKEHMFSLPRLDASESLRREKLRKLHNYVWGRCQAGCGAVDIGEASFTTSLNMMSTWLFSREFATFDSESSQEMKDAVWGVLRCIGIPNLADYFPVLRCVDPQGILKEARFYFGKLFAVLDEIIDEKLRLRMRLRSEKAENDDLLETLIDIHLKDEAELSRNDIKHLFFDLFVAGTDTTSSTVEWAMTELIRNPTKMSILRNEIRNFIQEKGKDDEVEESDIQQLPYLQAVVKETFRLHPVAPLLVPHKVNSDVEILNGYIVPKNTQILVNVWAIGRDPNVWANAHEFVPERFLNENNGVDFKGRDFELIPFGAGRRICPGMPLANRMVHQMLVTLVGNFEWKLEKEEEEMDMNETFGLSLQKAVPLKAIPRKI